MKTMIKCISGNPGEGKSYLMAKEIFGYLYDGRKVFCNFPFDGCYELTYEDMIKSEFPEGAALFIDEANSWFRNKDRKDLPIEVFQLFMHHRHFHMDMILISQNPIPLDINIRDIIQEWVWCSCRGITWVDDKGYLYKHAIIFEFEYYNSVEPMMKADEERMICKHWEFARKDVFKRFNSYYKFIEMNREEKQFRRWEEIMGRELVNYPVRKYKGFLHMIVSNMAKLKRRRLRTESSGEDASPQPEEPDHETPDL